ncbi:MAG: DUF4282 domain-containing protein [Pseudomonadota bacterium]
MGDIAGQFLSFDKMIGTTLIKVVYFIGLAFIAVGTVLSMLGSLGSIGSAPLAALGGVIIMPLIGLVGVIFWRFTCEMSLLLFKISDDLAEMKAARTTGAAPVS